MDLDTFILIGGRSSRMGRDKATLELGGRTFVEHTCDAISKAFPGSSVTLVARDSDQFPSNFHLPVIFDALTDRGPLGGLDAAFKAAAAEWALVLACDLPLVTPGVLRSLADLLDQRHDAVVPLQSDGRLQPLCAFYRVSVCRPIVAEMLADSSTPAAAAVLDRVTTLLVPLPDDLEMGISININTPQELNELISGGVK